MTDFPRCPQHPQSAPSSNPHPLQGQIWGHAGVDMVSGRHCMFSHSREFTCVWWLPRFHQRTLFRTPLPKLLSPDQHPCVLTSSYRIHISNHTLHHLQRRMSTSRFCRRQQALLQPSSMRSLTATHFPMGGPLKSFGNSRFATWTTPTRNSPWFVWDLAIPMKWR